MKSISNYSDTAKGSIFNPSDTINTYVMTGSSIAVAVPEGARFVSFSATGNFYVKFALAVATAGEETVNFSEARLGATVTGLANDATAYTATVKVDGVDRAVSVVGSAAQTFTDLITELDADTTGATSALVDGNLVITSSSTGASSAIAITDVDLFSTLTTFSSFGPRIQGIAASTAAIPAASVTDGSASALNPTVRDVSGLTSFAIIGAAGVIVSIAYYTA